MSAWKATAKETATQIHATTTVVSDSSARGTGPKDESMCPGRHTITTTSAAAAMKIETPGPGAVPNTYLCSSVPRLDR